MNRTSENFHSGVRQQGIRVARLVEDAGLTIILLATLVAGGIEIRHMWVQQNVMLTDLLLMFIYVETVTMVKIYWESGKLPVRMPLYIAIVARYLIIDVKDMEALRVIAVATSILVIAVAVLVVRWGHVKLPYPSSDESDRGVE